MFEALKYQIVYDDFKTKVSLTSEQIKLIDMLNKKYTYVKIGMELGMSLRTVNCEVKKLKKMFSNYKELEMSKLEVLKEN